MTLHKHWLVVMTKPKMEELAEEHLKRQGFDTYLPRWLNLKSRSNKNHLEKKRSPMFPRYLFIRPVHPEQSIAPIRSTRGVSQLVRFGVNPARASEALVESIRQLECSREPKEENLIHFKKGENLQVTEGPFAGVSAEVLECDQQRVILLIQILGQPQKIEFDTRACWQANFTQCSTH